MGDDLLVHNSEIRSFAEVMQSVYKAKGIHPSRYVTNIEQPWYLRRLYQAKGKVYNLFPILVSCTCLQTIMGRHIHKSEAHRS
jgi:hypothetical protein